MYYLLAYKIQRSDKNTFVKCHICDFKTWKVMDSVPSTCTILAYYRVNVGYLP